MSFSVSKAMKVGRIEYEGDRTLFFESSEENPFIKLDDGSVVRSRYEYMIIANPKKAENVQVGDTIIYEPCGGNFGFFERRLPAFKMKTYE